MWTFSSVKMGCIVDALLVHNDDLIRERVELKNKLDEANATIARFKDAVQEMKRKAGIRGRGRPRKVQP
jgi:hypothetical protein